jgi:hypothetical protein
MITTTGRVYEQRGQAYILTTRPAVDNLSDEVSILWHDSRMRTLEQIRKAFALMAEIGNYQGQTSDAVYGEQRLLFSEKMMDMLNGRMFHLSVASVSEASEFINFLVNLIVENGIPTREPLFTMCEDIKEYVYACLLNKKCCVCGRKADLHHVTTIGMGFNRNEKPQIGNLVLPLCREHHMEWHNVGGTEFESRYHIEPVQLDERLAKVYNLTKKARQTA